MKKFFQKIILWTYIKIHTILIYISIALYNTETEILKADPNDLNEKDKKETRKLHRNQLLEKFYQGQSDEKYVQDYYELLKKADKFIRKATPRQMAVAADKHGSNYGMKDQYGRRYEHYGFFDAKHKNAGKTLGEVLEHELKERRTKDDDYEILYIFNNIPIEVGFAKVLDVVEKTEKENADFEYEVLDIFQKSKQFDFPIKAFREEEVVNKIEQLTEFLHVKKIGFEYRQLEFFIPLKFGTEKIEENSEIFKEITNFKSIFVRNEYGELIGFGINKFIKRIKHNDTHEVWKFEGIEMQQMGLH
jgi:hypothetical protein